MSDGQTGSLPRMKLDFTLNLATLGGLIVGILSVGMWITAVNTKLDTVAQLVLDQKELTRKLDSMQAQISGQLTENHDATLENRKTFLRSEKAQGR